MRKIAEKTIECTRNFLSDEPVHDSLVIAYALMSPLNAHFDISCIGLHCFHLHPYFVYKICKGFDESVNFSRLN